MLRVISTFFLWVKLFFRCYETLELQGLGVLQLAHDMKRDVKRYGIQKDSTIITDIEKDGTIYFSGHSTDRINQIITRKLLEDDYLKIIRIKDNAL